MTGVYMIRNKVNGKYYVGSSVDIESRWKQHIKCLANNIHNNKHLQNAWNKYGELNFEFLVLEECNIETLRERETYYLKTLDCINKGYNIIDNANFGLGVSASNEVRKKISNACSGSKNGNYGRKRSKQEIQKIRDKRWGIGYVCKPRKPYIHVSEEQKLLNRQKASERMKNRIVSEETRHKLSERRKGTKTAAAVRLKMSENRKGEKNANSKLTKIQVLEIYEKMNNGVNYKDVCKEYNIGQCQAYKIKRKEHWVFNDI